MRTLLILLLAASSVGARAQDLEPLPPEQAFRVTAVAADDGVRLDWDLESGYYLYRKRFAFQTDTAGMELGEPLYPQGETHEDEFFGKSEVYRGQFSILIPVERTALSGDTLDLSIRSQGCADLGLCYPPQTWSRSVSLPRADAESDTGGLLSLIASGPNSGDQEFLPADEAFRFTAETVSRGWVELNWQIADGYYLYKHSLEFSALGLNQSVGQAVIPAGEPKEDEFFGRTEVFHRELSVRLPVQVPAGEALQLKVGYQGCAEGGICYPPIAREVQLNMSDVPAAAPEQGPGPVSEQDRLASLIRDGALPWVALTFFGFGLLLAFTPCVLPMVPILSSIIVGQGAGMNVRRAFSLSLTFVLAMALTYTFAGVVVALLGQNLQAAFQHPAVLIVFSGIFVALALAMFGFYEFQMPAALQTRLTEASQKQAGGTLIVIGQSGDAVRGGAALFALSLGMGAPLLAFGASAGKLLPRAGPWMDAVKQFFGLLLLGVAIWMIERIVPAAVAMVLWGLLMLLAGALVGGFGWKAGRHRPAGSWRRVAGAAALAYGVAILIGSATGATSPVRPLGALTGSDAERVSLDFRRVKTTADLDRELAAAARDGRLTMLDFYADWCVDCRKMDRYTFTDPGVVDALSGFVLLQADVTVNDAEDQALLKRFGIFGPPTIAFFDTHGDELGGFRQVGFATAPEFLAHVQRLEDQPR
jgi:thiol:disulfide interchange protein DsbD